MSKISELVEKGSYENLLSILQEAQKLVQTNGKGDLMKQRMNMVDDNGNTCLHICALKMATDIYHFDILEKIAREMEQTGTNPQTKNKQGQTYEDLYNKARRLKAMLEEGEKLNRDFDKMLDQTPELAWWSQIKKDSRVREESKTKANSGLDSSSSHETSSSHDSSSPRDTRLSDERSNKENNHQEKLSVSRKQKSNKGKGGCSIM